MGFHLRRDLVAAEEALEDPAYGRRIDLGPATAALAARLDGRDVDALIEELARAHGGRARVESMLRRFLLLGLVEEASPGTASRLRALRAGEARLAPVVLAGARFACQGSGACCAGHRLGPLADEDVASLAARGLGDAVVALEREGEPARYLRQVDGRCGFLEDDAGCGLHRRHGAEAKPGFCRLYPLEVMATVEGLRLLDGGGCATFAVSAGSGPPLAEQFPAARALVPRLPPIAHPVVRHSDRLLYDFAHVLAFTRWAIALLDTRRAPAGATLRAIGRRLVELGEAFAALPLEVGEPERTRDAVLARPAELEPPSGGLVREGAEMISVVAADLAELASGATVRAAFGERLAGEMAATLAAARDLTLRESEGATTPRRDLDALLRLSFRTSLFGPQALVADRPFAGLLRMAVIAACARASRDESLGHSHAVRLLGLRAAQSVLVQHEELALSALDGLCG
jgi:hypothetical protein